MLCIQHLTWFHGNAAFSHFQNQHNTLQNERPGLAKSVGKMLAMAGRRLRNVSTNAETVGRVLVKVVTQNIL
jgi:ATP-dependent protease ClpP protease subunit